MDLILATALINVGTGPDGSKAIIAADTQSGLRVIIPLDENGAKAVAAALSTGLVIPSGPLPPDFKGNGGTR